MPQTTEPNVRWARLKPYNPKRGCLVKRVIFMGALFKGGDGVTPGEIPEWHRMNLAQARALSPQRQTDDPYSRKMFDVVTIEQRKQIDLAEEDIRKAHYGYGPVRKTDLPDVSAPEQDDVSAPSKALSLADLANTPAPPDMADADEFADDDDTIGTIAGSDDHKAPSVAAPERDSSGQAGKGERGNLTDLADVPGRAAAAEGFGDAEFEEPFDINASEMPEMTDPDIPVEPDPTVQRSTEMPAPKPKPSRRGRGRK